MHDDLSCRRSDRLRKSAQQVGVGITLEDCPDYREAPARKGPIWPNFSHRGLVGSAIHQELERQGYWHILTHTYQELDLLDEARVNAFFTSEKPGYIFLAAAKVGGFLANNTYSADFIRDNLKI